MWGMAGSLANPSHHGRDHPGWVLRFRFRLFPSALPLSLMGPRVDSDAARLHDLGWSAVTKEALTHVLGINGDAQYMYMSSVWVWPGRAQDSD